MSSDTLKPLYGVFFQYDGTIDEMEVKKEFYSYGAVHSVKQILKRVYVNFYSEEGAEKCLQDGNEKYGEILKGRYGPREKRDSDNISVSSKGCPRKSYAHENNSSKYASQQDLEEKDEAINFNCISPSSRDVHQSEKKNSPGGLMSKLNHVKISPNKGENYPSTETCDTLRSSPSQHSIIHSSRYKPSSSRPYDEDFQDEPPELLSTYHHPRSSTNKYYEESESLPPLVSTSAKAAVSPYSLSRESASSHRSQGNKPPELLSVHHQPHSSTNQYYEESESPPPLVSTSAKAVVSPYSLSRESASSHRSQGDKPPELLSVHHQPHSSTNQYYEESENPPPLVSTSANAMVSPDSLSQELESSCRLQTNDVHKYQNGVDVPTDIDIPPLIQTAVSTPARRNGFQACHDETHDPFSSYSKQVLIANLPMDITRNEIEKILYPLEPVYVTDLDMTNIRLKIGFVQILFADEEEANQAARLFDGLTLRGHYLSVKKVIDLVSLE